MTSTTYSIINTTFLFPITRLVLIEKHNIYSFTQLKRNIEQQLKGCSVYYSKRFGDTFFYIKNNVVFLEAQMINNGIFYLNYHFISTIQGNNNNFNHDLKSFIIKLLNVNLEKYDIDKITFSISRVSNYDYVIENCEKLC